MDCKSDDMIGMLAGMNSQVEGRVVAGGSASGIPGNCHLSDLLSICSKKHLEQKFMYDPGTFDN